MILVLKINWWSLEIWIKFYFRNDKISKGIPYFWWPFVTHICEVVIQTQKYIWSKMQNFWTKDLDIAQYRDLIGNSPNCSLFLQADVCFYHYYMLLNKSKACYLYCSITHVWMHLKYVTKQHASYIYIYIFTCMK